MKTIASKATPQRTAGLKQEETRYQFLSSEHSDRSNLLCSRWRPRRRYYPLNSCHFEPQARNLAIESRVFLAVLFEKATPLMSSPTSLAIL